jgi:hypothetical protein
MPLLRLLVALASVALLASGWLLQHDAGQLFFDACPSLQQLSVPCPPWAGRQPVPEFMFIVCYVLAGLGAVFAAWPLVDGLLDRPPEAVLAEFIQRGRDLHERCRREGEDAVRPAIDEWTREVAQFLRRLGHKYVVAFGDYHGVELFASQYDTAVTREIRQRLARLTEFEARFRSASPAPD